MIEPIQRALHLMLFSGYFALASTGAYGKLHLLLWFGLLACSFLLRAGRPGTRTLRPVLAVFVMFVSLADVLLQSSGNGVRQFGVVTAWMGLLGLYRPQARPPINVSLLATLAMVLSSAMLTTSIAFLVSLSVFILMGAGMLITLASEDPRGGLMTRVPVPFVKSARGPRRPVMMPQQVSDGSRTRQTMGMSAAILLTSIFLFFIIPRFGAGWFFSAQQAQTRRPGFSDQVRLGALGEMLDATDIVMRVKIVNREQPPGPLRWRGVALDHFDGRTWKETEAGEWVLQNNEKGMRESRSVVERPYRSKPDLLEHRVFLEEGLDGVLFGATRVMRVSGKFSRLAQSSNQSLKIKFPAFSTRSYVVYSDLGRPDDAQLRAKAARIQPKLEARYLQLPDLLTPRVRAYAEKITQGATTDIDRVRAVENHLLSRFTYELRPKVTNGVENPVETFLFETKTGHCEFFSSAMVVLLRSLGIPARVVNGFSEGEFNHNGGYYVVRSNEAHSWTEVHFTDYGWIDFDATPPGLVEKGPLAELRRKLSMYLDSIRMAWYLYVIDYNLLDQITYVKSFIAYMKGEPTVDDGTGQGGGTVIGTGIPRIFWILAFILGILAVMWVAVRLAIKPRLGRTAQIPSMIYQDMVQILRVAGIRREEHETPRELAGRVRASWTEGAPMVEALTAWFEAIRYRGDAMTEESHAKAKALLAALATAAKPPR